MKTTRRVFLKGVGGVAAVGVTAAAVGPLTQDSERRMILREGATGRALRSGDGRVLVIGSAPRALKHVPTGDH